MLSASACGSRRVGSDLFALTASLKLSSCPARSACGSSASAAEIVSAAGAFKSASAGAAV